MALKRAIALVKRCALMDEQGRVCWVGTEADGCLGERDNVSIVRPGESERKRYRIVNANVVEMEKELSESTGEVGHIHD